MSVAPNSPFPFAIWPNNDLKKSRKPTPASRVGSYVVNGTRRYRDDSPTRFESTSSLTPRLVTKETHTADGHPFDEEDHLLDMEHESDQAEHAQSLPREERERRYGDARYTARTRSPVEARDDLPHQSSMRRTKKAYDPKRHASQEDAERAVKDAHDKWLASGGADPKPKKPKGDKPAKPDWKVQGQQRILRSPRSEPRQNMMNRSMRRGTMRKSVPMGYSFDNPMPIPFHDDGLPNWDGVPHGCFASLPMDNGPLKGKVVVLHRLQNGMYIISPDGKLSNPQNRDKDKGKLRKERPEVATDDNYGTEMTEKSLRRMRKGFSEKLRDEFLILAGYKPQQLRKADERRPLNPRAAEKIRWATDGSYRLEPLPSDDPETAIRNHNEAVVGNHRLAGGTIETLDRSKLKELPKSKPAKPEGAVNRPAVSRPKLSADERRQAQEDAFGFRMEMREPVRSRVVRKSAPQPGKEPWTNRQGRPTLRGQSRRIRASGYVDTGIENNGLPGPHLSIDEQNARIRQMVARDRVREAKRDEITRPYVEAMGYNPNDKYKRLLDTQAYDRVKLEKEHADVPTAHVQPKRDALAAKHLAAQRSLIDSIRADHAKSVGQEPMPKELRPIAGLTRLHPEHFASGHDWFSRPEDPPREEPRNVPRAYIPDSDKRAE